MTKERKEEIVLIALVLSLVTHIGLMVYARPKAMVRVADGIARFVSRGPMRVTKNVAQPEPVRIGSLMDVNPKRDEPPVKNESVPLISEMGVAVSIAPEKPNPTVPALDDPIDDRPVFDARPIPVSETVVSAKIPMSPIETPAASSKIEASAPDVGRVALVGAMPVDIAIPAIGKDPQSLFSPNGIASVWQKPATHRDGPKPEEFKPSEKVYEKVDEKIVNEEKAAVKKLVEAENAVGLEKFVNVAIKSSSDGKWTYFKVMVTPRSDLEVVPKDVVLILDASGSIGKDRMHSIQRAAKGILRSMTNSGDRFNLVAFRNRFTYAFRAWQECNRASFDSADRWLGNLTAHGRTDVFSTIASVLTLPRDPKRPLIAMVVTDGDANYGVSDTAEILSRFSRLNDGLISVYMYGVKSSANRELIDVLTHGNRGESLVFEGWKWYAGDDLGKLSERFRDPVLSDLRVVFSASTPAEVYPRLLRNVYSGDMLSFVGRVHAGTRQIAFSLKGLNGSHAYEGFFKLPLVNVQVDDSLATEWRKEQGIDKKLK